MILLLNTNYNAFSETSSGSRDSDILDFLSQEDLTSFTFEGLKRRLGLHPETLSRILIRLEQEGFVRKSAEGYVVVQEIARSLRAQRARSPESRVLLLQTYLPSDMPVQQLVSSLRGKWFGLLRWLGIAETNENVVLKWITEDGDIQIDAKITETQLTIEATFIHDSNANRALRASYQLMAYIGRLCSRSPMARHVAYFGGPGFQLMSA